MCSRTQRLFTLAAMAPLALGCGDFPGADAESLSQLEQAVTLKYKVAVHTGHLETRDLLKASNWQTVRTNNDGFWVGANTFTQELSPEERRAIVALSTNQTGLAGLTYKQAEKDATDDASIYTNVEAAMGAGITVRNIMVYNKDPELEHPAMTMTPSQIQQVRAWYPSKNVLINIRDFHGPARAAIDAADGFSFELGVTADDYDKLEALAQAIEYGFEKDKSIFILTPPRVDHNFNHNSYLNDYKEMVRWLRDRVGAERICRPRVRFVPANYKRDVKEIPLAPELDGTSNANTQLGVARWLIRTTSICG